jgi:hypothetical protein
VNKWLNRRIICGEWSVDGLLFYDFNFFVVLMQEVNTGWFADNIEKMIFIIK